MPLVISRVCCAAETRPCRHIYLGPLRMLSLALLLCKAFPESSPLLVQRLLQCADATAGVSGESRLSTTHHLEHLAQVPQIEGVVALGGRWQELGLDLGS